MNEKKYTLALDDIGLDIKEDILLTEWLNPSTIDRCGIVTGVSDIAPLVNWAKRVEFLDVHLNITENLARTGLHSKDIKKATFGRRAAFLKRVALGEITSSYVKNEWRKQIEAFIKIFGSVPHGLNSHEHVHFYPPYFKIIVDLAKKYSISYVRLGNKSPIFLSDWRTWVLHIPHGQNMLALKKTSIQTSSKLILDINYIMQGKKEIGDGVEVVLHPYEHNDISFLRVLN